MDTHADELSQVEKFKLPVFARARDYGARERVPSHKHSVAQLLHTLSGVMLVDTPGRAWAIPPGRGLWLPPGTLHSFAMVGRVSVRTLYVRRPHATLLSNRPFVMEISPLVRELIIRAIEIDARSPRKSADLIARLLLTELADAPRDEFALALPRTPVLKRFAEIVRTDPSAQRSLQDIASSLGVSAKTIARRCVSETGLPPDQWRRQTRLLVARALLASGLSVTRTAADVGFGSASSFTAAFRLAFGVTPSQLVRGKRARMERGLSPVP